MSAFNKYKKFVSIRFAVGLLVVGLLFAAVSAFIFMQPEKEKATVNATIEDIRSEQIGEDTNYYVTVSYEVDGKQYTAELGAYQSGWKVGDVIECTYEADNPENISYGDGKMIVIVVFAVGVVAVVAGIVMLVKSVKKPSKDYAQYNRVDEATVDPQKKAQVEQNTEPAREYVFHFTGKLNQSYVMEEPSGLEVYRAECGGITLLKDTDYEFVNLQNGNRSAKKIGHTTTTSVGSGMLLPGNVTSAFKIDGNNCWDVLAEMGYGFDFSLRGIKCHYEVKHYGVPVGSIENAGTEVLNEKYQGNPLAKLPTNGIFKIVCKPAEIEGFFLICFCLAKTEATVD